MNPRVLVAALLISVLCVSVAPVSGLATKYWDVQLDPDKGSTTQSILLRIRMSNGEEPTGTTPRYIYVFYDGNVLVKRQVATYTLSTGLYAYAWDITITVPQTASGTIYGEHIIKVSLEEADGSFNDKEVEYTITGGKPVGDWWSSQPASYWVTMWANCPPEMLAVMKGERGEQGEAGEAGEDGVTPSINYSDLADGIDYAEFWGSVPADVRAELKGETGASGAAGAPGKDADPTLTYAALALSIIANVAWILPKLKEKRKQ